MYMHYPCYVLFSTVCLEEGAGPVSQTGEEWLSLREAAEMLGMHPATVRLWADRNELPSRRTNGGHRRFHGSVWALGGDASWQS